MFSHCVALFSNDKRVSMAVVVNISSCKSCTGFVQCLNCPFPMIHPTKQHPAYRLIIFPLIVILSLAKCCHCTSLAAAVSNYLFSNISFSTSGLSHTVCHPCKDCKVFVSLLQTPFIPWYIIRTPHPTSFKVRNFPCTIVHDIIHNHFVSIRLFSTTNLFFHMFSWPDFRYLHSKQLS
jgi:hypothetical protein